MMTRSLLRRPWYNLVTLVASLLVGLTLHGRAVQAAAIKVACIGDQMTHSDLFSNNRETQPVGMQEYPRKLQDLMGSGYDVRNFGDCCASVIGGYPHSETHPYVSGSNYKNAVAFAPDIVIIGPWGRHDWGKSAMTALPFFTVMAFQTGYEDIITKFQALPSKPKIYVSTLVPLPFGMDGPDNGYKTSPQNDVVKALAAKYNLPTIDLFTAFTNQPTLFIQPPQKDSDGEHTSDAGSTKIAQMVEAALKGTATDGGVSGPPDASQSGGTTGSGGVSGTGGAGGTVGATGGGGTAGAGVSSGSAGTGPAATGAAGATTTGSSGSTGTAVSGAAGTGVAATTGAAGTGVYSGAAGSASSGAAGNTSTGTGTGTGTGTAGASGAGPGQVGSPGDSGTSGCRVGSGAPGRALWGSLVMMALFALALGRARGGSNGGKRRR